MTRQFEYIASITRESFMYYEMKTTAQLMIEDLKDDAIIETIFQENRYQYPTNRSLKRNAKVCLRRLHRLEDKELIRWIVERPTGVSKQICLYAFMLDSRIFWDFMITIIGEKYRTLNYAYDASEITVFLQRLREQNEKVATWSEQTIKKIRSTISSTLKINGYIDNRKSTKLNPVLLDYKLKDKILESDNGICLPAFNDFK